MARHCGICFTSQARARAFKSGSRAGVGAAGGEPGVGGRVPAIALAANGAGADPGVAALDVASCCRAEPSSTAKYAAPATPASATPERTMLALFMRGG